MSTALELAAISATLAGLFDLSQRRIPNWLTLGTFVVGLGFNAWHFGLAGTAAALLGTALGLGLLLPAYTLRVVGAGDVKLLAALGALLGTHVLVSVAIYGAIVGGLLSLALVVRRRQLGILVHQVLARLTLPLQPLPGSRAPYGVAIASGVYLSCVLPGVLG